MIFDFFSLVFYFYFSLSLTLLADLFLWRERIVGNFSGKKNGKSLAEKKCGENWWMVGQKGPSRLKPIHPNLPMVTPRSRSSC